MAGIFTSFSNYGSVAVIIKWLGYFILAILGAAVMTFIIVPIIAKATSLNVIEITIGTNRMKRYTARFKKNGKGQKMLYLAKYKKFLPQIQEDDKYNSGKKETIILIKDQNGLHHTARLPTSNELKEWYQAVYDINIEQNPELAAQVHQLYLLPNPSENLDWLASQIAEVNKQFIDSWWKSPVIMWIATVSLCAFTFILTIFITRKL